MRVHYSDVHYATTHSKRGRPSKAAINKAKADRIALWKEVKYFQRAFVQGLRSQYFLVWPRPRLEQHIAQYIAGEVDARVDCYIDQEVEDIIRCGNEAKANANRVIEEGGVDKVNCWID